MGVSASAVRRTRKHSAAAGVSKSIPRINWETAFFPTKLRKSLEKSEKMLGNGRYNPFLGGSKLLLIFQGELLKMVKKYDGMAFIAFFSP